MSQLEVWLDDDSLGGPVRVGLLSKSSSRSGDTLSFEYDGNWLGQREPVPGFALDPQLWLAPGAHYAREGAGMLTGAFQDCSPDRWGKRLMDRREALEAREQGRAPRALRAWDYLTGVNDQSRMGALRLFDAASTRYVDDRVISAPPYTELRQLEAIAAKVESGDAEDSDHMVQWLRQLIAPGASLGGARPKASFRDERGELWLAKFPSADDRYDVGLWELLTQELALASHVQMPPAKRIALSDRGHTYAVQRFDRTASSRRAFASAMSLLDVSESEGFSYLDIVQLIETSGASRHIDQDLEQLFRRVLFSILVGNRDDHLRNHGFLRADDGWRLSPAFDVNPNVDRDQHVLAIDERDASPDSSVLMKVADFYRLDKRRAADIAAQVRDAVRTWQARARAAGATGREIDLMRAVIDSER